LKKKILHINILLKELLEFYQKIEIFEIPNLNKIPSFNISFLKFCCLLFVFLFFLLFLTFYFQFRLSVVVKKF